jgi:hypothetical protein
MPTIISNQEVDFIDWEIAVKTLTELDGTERKFGESSIERSEIPNFPPGQTQTCRDSYG